MKLKKSQRNNNFQSKSSRRRRACNVINEKCCRYMKGNIYTKHYVLKGSSRSIATYYEIKKRDRVDFGLTSLL